MTMAATVSVDADLTGASYVAREITGAHDNWDDATRVGDLALMILARRAAVPVPIDDFDAFVHPLDVVRRILVACNPGEIAPSTWDE